MVGSDPATHRTLPFRPDIEGLRGIAIVLVVLYHAGVPGFAGGYVGVDVFFVLSGFLITQILQREVHGTGTVDLGAFYARRIRRLLPAAAVVLLATMAAGAVVFSPLAQERTAHTAVWAAGYLSNLHFANQATDYLAPDVQANPLLHMWSLSVEEQFYLAWPLLIVAAAAAARRFRRNAPGPTRGRAGDRRPDRPVDGPAGRAVDRGLVVTTAVVAVASLAYAVWLTGANQPLAFFMPHARAWEFAVGGLAGLLAPSLRGARGPWAGRAGAVAGVAGLATVVAANVAFDDATPFPGLPALLPVLGTAALLLAGDAAPRSPVARLLRLRPLREAGRLSYSWYLWHWPALVFAAALGGELPLATRVAVGFGSVLLAEATYRLVENPVRHHPRLRARRAATFLLALVVTGTGLAAASAWRLTMAGLMETPRYAAVARASEDLPRHFEEDCRNYVHPAEGEVRCVYGDPASETTIVLFGDSHAAHWFGGLEAAAEAHGWRLLPINRGSCPPVDVRVADGVAKKGLDRCEAWREKAFAGIAALDPAVVVTSSFPYYGIPQDAWTLGVERLFTRLSASARHVVHLRDVPDPDVDVPECLLATSWRASWLGAGSCDFPRDGHLDRRYAHDARTARAFPRVTTLDLTGHICPGETCPTVVGDTVVYRDGNHITETFATTLAGPLGEAIAGLLDGRARSD